MQAAGSGRACHIATLQLLVHIDFCAASPGIVRCRLHDLKGERVRTWTLPGAEPSVAETGEPNVSIAVRAAPAALPAAAYGAAGAICALVAAAAEICDMLICGWLTALPLLCHAACWLFSCRCVHLQLCLPYCCLRRRCCCCK